MKFVPLNNFMRLLAHLLQNPCNTVCLKMITIVGRVGQPPPPPSPPLKISQSHLEISNPPIIRFATDKELSVFLSLGLRGRKKLCKST